MRLAGCTFLKTSKTDEIILDGAQSKFRDEASLVGDSRLAVRAPRNRDGMAGRWYREASRTGFPEIFFLTGFLNVGKQIGERKERKEKNQLSSEVKKRESNNV